MLTGQPGKIKQSEDFTKCSEKVVSLLLYLLDNKSLDMVEFGLWVAFMLLITVGNITGQETHSPSCYPSLQAAETDKCEQPKWSSHQSEHLCADGDLH